MDIQIRKLEISDHIEYISLMKQFRPIDVEIDFTRFKQMYNYMFQNSEIYVAVAIDTITQNTVIVGSITVIYEQKFINDCALYAHIEDVIVDEMHRNLKIGSKLLEYAKQQAIKKNCFKCTLVCSESTSPFYQINEFEHRGVCMSYLIKK